MDGWRVRLRAHWTRNVLADVDAITRAQAQAASDPACRHGPQAARVLLEGAGMIGGIRDLTVNGDVTVETSVSVDARSVTLLAAQPADLQAELARIRGTLGVG
jgi:hypothetical protein